MSRGAALAPVLAVALLASARAQEQPPAASTPAAGDPAGLIEAARAGFDGYLLPAAFPSPVWITLRHPGHGPALRLEVLALGSDSARARAAVELPPGARRRVCLAVAAQGEVLLELRVDGERVAQRALTGLPILAVERHLLSIDGRPEDERRAGGSYRDDPSLRVTAIAPEDAPTEAACYTAFGAVLVRGVDPGAWGADRLSALLEYVAQGGTLLVPGLDVRAAEARALLASFPGGPVEVKLLGRPARAHSLGLGRAVAFPDDPLEAALAAGAKAAQARQDLGDLVGEEEGNAELARTYEPWSAGASEHPGLRAGLAVVGFTLLYLLVAGPVLGFALRRASRVRLAWSAAAIVLSFTLLAPLVASAVARADGRAVIREAVRVFPDGSALHLGQLTCVSGGGTEYALELATEPRQLGPTCSLRFDLAATLLAPGVEPRQEWSGNRYRWRPPSLVSAETTRGPAFALDLATNPWGQRSVATVAMLDGVPPLEARLVPDGDRRGVRITNTTGVPIEHAIVVEDGLAIDGSAPFVEVGPLAPGETRLVAAPVRRRSGDSSLPGAEERTWAKALGVSIGWTAWSTAFTSPHLPSGALRYVVVSRGAGLLRAKGAELAVDRRAVRIDPVEVAVDVSQAWLGVVIEEGARQFWAGGGFVEARIARVVPGSPAEQAGLTAGLRVYKVEGEFVGSPDQLRGTLRRQLAGERLALEVIDPQQGGGTRRVVVRLVVRPPGAEGD